MKIANTIITFAFKHPICFTISLVATVTGIAASVVSLAPAVEKAVDNVSENKMNVKVAYGNFNVALSGVQSGSETKAVTPDTQASPVK